MYFVLYNIMASVQCDVFYYPHFSKLLRKWKLEEAKSHAQAYRADDSHKLY